MCLYSGISGIQLDMKVRGLDMKIIEEAIYQAKRARPQLLECVTKDLQKARPMIKNNAPLVEILRYGFDFLNSVITHKITAGCYTKTKVGA